MTKRRAPSEFERHIARFLTLAQIHRAVAEVAALAESAGVRVALIGGVAMQRYGSARLTLNVDFAASGAIDALPVEQPLAFGGYVTKAPCGVPVTVIVRSDEYAPLYALAITTAVPAKSLAATLVMPEELAAMKFATRRGARRIWSTSTI